MHFCSTSAGGAEGRRVKCTYSAPVVRRQGLHMQISEGAGKAKSRLKLIELQAQVMVTRDA